MAGAERDAAALRVAVREAEHGEEEQRRRCDKLHSANAAAECDEGLLEGLEMEVTTDTGALLAVGGDCVCA